MTAVASPAKDDGSGVVEMLVAATLTIIAVAMLAGDALPALRMLERAAQPDLRRVELVNTGEVVARAVRAARPDVTRAAVEGNDRRLTIGLGSGSTLEITLDAGRLVLSVDGEPAASAPFPTGVLVDGLDPDRSRFALLDRDGEVTDEAARVAAVAVLLADGEHEVIRVVALRMRSHLDGVLAW